MDTFNCFPSRAGGGGAGSPAEAVGPAGGTALDDGSAPREGAEQTSHATKAQKAIDFIRWLGEGWNETSDRVRRSTAPSSNAENQRFVTGITCHRNFCWPSDSVADSCRRDADGADPRIVHRLGPIPMGGTAALTFAALPGCRRL